MSSAELVFNCFKCEKCGYIGLQSEMQLVNTVFPIDPHIGEIYECKDQSQCFDMLQVIDEFVDSE